MTNYVDLGASIVVKTGINLGDNNEADILIVAAQFMKRPDRKMSPSGISLLTNLSIARCREVIPKLVEADLIEAFDDEMYQLKT